MLVLEGSSFGFQLSGLQENMCEGSQRPSQMSSHREHLSQFFHNYICVHSLPCTRLVEFACKFRSQPILLSVNLKKLRKHEG